jgi:hypothetical protein
MSDEPLSPYYVSLPELRGRGQGSVQRSPFACDPAPYRHNYRYYRHGNKPDEDGVLEHSGSVFVIPKPHQTPYHLLNHPRSLHPCCILPDMGGCEADKPFTESAASDLVISPPQGGSVRHKPLGKQSDMSRITNCGLESVCFFKILEQDPTLGVTTKIAVVAIWQQQSLGGRLASARHHSREIG